jgi:hypothetical protein
VTTGLLSGTGYAKDNRLLPAGFDKATAGANIATHGEARTDDTFNDAGDSVRYVVELGQATGPFAIEVAVRYQPIAFRWAQNLQGYDAPEPRRFVRFYESMASQSSIVLARAGVRY